MIDLGTEQPVPLTAATRFYPRQENGKATHISTLYRHASHGCRGVVLETIMCGGRRCTTREAVTRFFVRLSESDDQQAKTTSADAAGQKLDALVFRTSRDRSGRSKDQTAR